MAPPLQLNGTERFTIVNNEIARVVTYDLHECDPAQVEAWRAEMEAKRKDAEEWSRLRGEDYDVARTQVCPKCDAQPTEDCVNLNVLKWKGIKQSVVIAHYERVELGYKTMNLPLPL